MNQKPKRQKKEQARDVSVEDAWQRLRNNRNDNVENTFCQQLFEEHYFNEELFIALCNDMKHVLRDKPISKEEAKLLTWIIICIFRSMFSHYEEKDLYKINNFNKKLSEKWSNEYFEELRNFMTDVLEAI